MLEERSRVSVIRQVAIILALWCLLLVAGLLAIWAVQRQSDGDGPPGQPQEPLPGRYAPAKKDAALKVLFAAIRPVDGDLPALLDAQAWTTILPVCALNPPHGLRGKSVFDALVEQAALLDERLARMSVPGRADNLVATGGGVGSTAPQLLKRYRLDPAAWAALVQAQGQRCQHALQALRLLASERGAPLLADALWAERARRKLKAPTPERAAVAMAPGALSQEDPWRGWPGCIWLTAAQADGTAYYLGSVGRADLGRQLCAQPGMLPAGARLAQAVTPARAGRLPPADSPAWAVPHDLALLLAPLDRLRLPSGKVFDDYAAALPPDGSYRRVGRNSVRVGMNLHLTLDARTQSVAQQMADCYTGRQEACAMAGVATAQVASAQGPDARQMWEGAAARMTAVVVIDVASGRIEALASAHTPCYAQEHAGAGRDPGCTPLWTTPKLRPEALLNHAIYTDYMPGSTVKPIMASVFFEEPRIPPAVLADRLAHSDTDYFNQVLYCGGDRNRSRDGSAACTRPLRVQQRASALGWNADCTDQPTLRCDHADLLFGRRLSQRLVDDDASAALASAAPIQQQVLTGRMFVEPTSASANQPAGSQRLMALPSHFGSAVNCQGTHKSQQTACALGVPTALLNEAYGQGQARATALGVATMLSRLSAAAQDLTAVRRPYLVEQITDAHGRPVAPAALRSGEGQVGALARPEPLGVSPAVAKLTLKALGGGVRDGGTGNLICRHVFGPQCASQGQHIAGKTGTPSFGPDRLTLAEARSHCRAKPQPEECLERPVKWYVAAYSSRIAQAKPFDKVIAVISERNWYLPAKAVPELVRDRIHGGRDPSKNGTPGREHDTNNISTEVAMRVMARQWQVQVQVPVPAQVPASGVATARAARPW